ncbi:hypothetical protein FH968_19930 [Buttiauxella sp. B2]|uniref:hypothetical protein n=1 Tax=Buttiauxella sp. B2 TaxID=2587812 RepID=UPI00111F101A|nr:hypothetical protein [Buttiauxella sp. B2]TNV16111.1 hypothetical protein FH968_19930 [Buttiauxella sp. B2]
MAMLHVRLRKYQKQISAIETHLNKERVSKSEKIISLVVKQERPPKKAKEPVKPKKKRNYNPYSDYGISAIGREKRKGKSMPPRELYGELLKSVKEGE